MNLLVVDNDGQHVEFARTLAKSGLFASVGLFVHWRSDTPILQDYAPGVGWPEIKREFELFSCIERYDAFAFPALYNSDMQRWLRASGIPVWGCDETEMLERNRVLLLQTMEALGMKVPKYKVTTLEKARTAVEDGDILKFSSLRGDTETISINGDDLSWYFELGEKWGPLRNSVPVVHQKPLPKGCEIGYDTIYVRGKLVQQLSIGYEAKDGGYVEKNIYSDKLPPPMRPIFAVVEQMIGSEYSNFMSTEIMSKTLLDITTRYPQPPGDLKLYNWQGLPHIIFAHLSGMKVIPETNPRGKYGVQLIAHNNQPKNYVRFGKIPKDIADRVFFNRAFVMNGEVWCPPWADRSVSDWADAAGVCGTGSSVQAAIDEAVHVAKELPLPHDIIIDPTVSETLWEAIHDGEKEGYYF